MSTLKAILATTIQTRRLFRPRPVPTKPQPVGVNPHVRATMQALMILSQRRGK
jgi:hypothetical protein